ncbi:hypothetical protein BTVI_00972 [Pitangus sulphuratus]|nr:hypothetical protein BTVI_00972 [Pitangus sulphuratus]
MAHSEGPGQDGEVGQCEPHEIQQGQMQGPTPGLGQTQALIQAGEWNPFNESSPGEKDLEVSVDKKLTMLQSRGVAAQKVNHVLGCIKSTVGSR